MRPIVLEDGRLRQDALEIAERVQDAVGAAIAAGTGDGVSLSYDDAGNAINVTNTDKGSSAVAAHEAAADPHPQYAPLGSLAELPDVDATGIADGFVLKWDAANAKWIVAAESGGGGGDPYITATAAENLPAMTPVHIGASGVTVADATSGKPAHGYVRMAVASGNPADVYAFGLLTTTGLTAGATYYLRAAGALGAAMLGVGEIRQPLGVAISTTELAVSIGVPITRIS